MVKSSNYRVFKLDVGLVIEEETKLAPYQVKDLVKALDKTFKRYGVDRKLEQ